MHFGIQLHRVKLSMFAEMKEKKSHLYVGSFQLNH